MITCERVTKSYPVGRGRKQVLKGIDLKIRPGEHMGFLGRNGAGKTTFIKLIGGVELPTSGRIKRHMSVSWPLGFWRQIQGSLTGYDNARFIARIYGRDYSEIRNFVEDFSELGAQLKMPVKTYSSGMRARLPSPYPWQSSSIAILIDEVIMVGDQNFHKKCHFELFERRADRALIFASHSSELVREFCDRALVLDGGLGTIYRDVNEALDVYASL